MVRSGRVLLILLVGVAAAAATKISGADDVPSGAWNGTATDRLRQALLPGYDRSARPAAPSALTTITVAIRVRHATIDEEKSTITLQGWFSMKWQDDKLKWNSSEFGLDTVRLADHEIWQPDVTLYNSAAGSSVDNFGSSYAIVWSSGLVLWVPPVELVAFCELDLTKWPRDKHTCLFVLGSWTYDGNQIDLQLATPDGIDRDEAVDVLALRDSGARDGGAWRIESVSASRGVKHYACCTEPYVEIRYAVHVARRGRAQIIAAELPALAILLLFVAAVVKPAANRFTPLAAVAVLSALYLLHLPSRLPALADRPPRLLTLYCGTLLVASAWLVGAALVARLAAKAGPAPKLLRKLLPPSKGATRLVALFEEDEVRVRVSEGAEKTERTPAESKAGAREWPRLAALLDRTLLLLGAVALVVILIFCI